MTLIIIDGLDGSGKSTQAKLVMSLLETRGKTVRLRVHPESDNFFGEKARQFLIIPGKSAHFASALFYMIDVIRSILLYSWQRFDYLIFVRYLMGTAYLPSPLHEITYHFFALVVPKSDTMIFLDVRPEVAANRINRSRYVMEVFEGIDALRRVRVKALSLARDGKWTVIDGNKSEEEVLSSIKRIVR